MTNIWVLLDYRTGNSSQTLGVAEALGLPFEEKQIAYNPLVRLPNYFRDFGLVGVDKKKSSPLEGPWPDLVISTGRRLAPVAQFIKRQSGDKTKTVHIMWPGAPISDLDMVVVPEHDEVPEMDGIVRTYASPNRITKEKLEMAEKTWVQTFANLPEPKIALILGGDTKHGPFTPEQAKELFTMINVMAVKQTGSVLITTSRRTNRDIVSLIYECIKVPYYLYDVEINEGEDNPYMGILAVANSIVVTGDSISMCSEASSTGKPVFIYAPKSAMHPKFVKFHQHLFHNNYARPLIAGGGSWSYEPLNDAAKVAEAIRNTLLA